MKKVSLAVALALSLGFASGAATAATYGQPVQQTAAPMSLALSPATVPVLAKMCDSKFSGFSASSGYCGKPDMGNAAVEICGKPEIVNTGAVTNCFKAACKASSPLTPQNTAVLNSVFNCATGLPISQSPLVPMVAGAVDQQAQFQQQYAQQQVYAPGQPAANSSFAARRAAAAQQ